MNKKILTVFLLVFFLHSNAQKSTEEDNYNKSFHYTEFKPIDTSKILSFTAFGVNINEVKNFTPFKTAYHYTPYQDSIFRSHSMPLNDAKAEGINNFFIIKHEENSRYEAIIYLDGKYNDYTDEQGIWIAVYNKKEKSLKKYYTGLSQNAPLHIKWDSKFPLIKNDTVLQIEASLLQKISVAVIPGKPAEYKLVKDGLLIEFDLKKIALDSDNDGLTDIEENKMMLNPYSSDTDNDGIPDKTDANPRFSLPRTDKTIIYEAIIDNITNNLLCDSLFSRFNGSINDSVKTYLIISNSADIQAINKVNKRIIILTEEEYKTAKEKYYKPLSRFYFSPLFKIDGTENTYQMYVSPTSGSMQTFIIKKTGKGWEIKMSSFSIA
jgi:hypothetical protein